MKIKKIMTVVMAAVLAFAVTGCTANVTVETKPKAEEEKKEEPAKEETAKGSEKYFSVGVYLNTTEGEKSENDKYYVFSADTYGHTDDGISGLPFDYENRDGGVWFSFADTDPEDEDYLTVESVDNGVVTGTFKDGKKQVFTPVADVDPETFDAENYKRSANGEDLIYRDANGWRVRYDPKLFTVNGGGPSVSFVYTGESAGTNMITASYNVDKDAKTAIADLAKEWGDKASTSEGIFPGTEDVTGYWVTLPPEQGTSGLYCTAIARDYMQGYLLFELTGHNSGNDEEDMAVSDALASVIDSLEFAVYN